MAALVAYDRVVQSVSVVFMDCYPREAGAKLPCVLEAANHLAYPAACAVLGVDLDASHDRLYQ